MGKKYLTTSPRYIGGKYIDASPEKPAIVEVPDGVKPDSRLIELDKDGKPVGYQKPKAHFAEKKGGAAPTAAQHFDAKKKTGNTEDGPI